MVWGACPLWDLNQTQPIMGILISKQQLYIALSFLSMNITGDQGWTILFSKHASHLAGSPPRYILTIFTLHYPIKTSSSQIFPSLPPELQIQTLTNQNSLLAHCDRMPRQRCATISFIHTFYITCLSSPSHPEWPTSPVYTNTHFCPTLFCRSLPRVSNLFCSLPAPSTPTKPVQTTNPTQAKHHFSQAVASTSLRQSAIQSIHFYYLSLLSCPSQTVWPLNPIYETLDASSSQVFSSLPPELQIQTLTNQNSLLAHCDRMPRQRCATISFIRTFYITCLSSPSHPEWPSPVYTNTHFCLTIFCRSLPCVSDLFCSLPALSSPNTPVQTTNPIQLKHHSSHCTACRSSPSHPVRPTTPAYTNNHAGPTIFCRSLPSASNLLCSLPAPFSPGKPVQTTNPIQVKHHCSQAVESAHPKGCVINVLIFLVFQMLIGRNDQERANKRHILTNLVTKIRLRHILTNLVTKIRHRHILTNPVLTVLKVAGWRPAMGWTQLEPP